MAVALMANVLRALNEAEKLSPPNEEVWIEIQIPKNASMSEIMGHILQDGRAPHSTFVPPGLPDGVQHTHTMQTPDGNYAVRTRINRDGTVLLDMIVPAKEQ